MFAPPIACQTLPYSELPFRRAVDGIARAGYPCLAFGTTHEGVETPDPLDPDDRTLEYGRIVADAGLVPVMMFGPRGGVTGDDGRDLYKRRLDQARLLGVEHVLAWGPWEYKNWPDEKHPPDVWEAMCEEWFTAMAPVVQHAEAVGVTLVAKPHTGLTAHAARCRETVERIDSPNFRVCYDGGNVHFYEGLDPAEDIKLCADITAALCVKDHTGPRGNPLFPCPGEGEVDHEAMLRALAPHGFDGPCAVERFEGEHKKAEMPPELIDELAARAFAHLSAVAQRVAAT